MTGLDPVIATARKKMPASSAGMMRIRYEIKLLLVEEAELLLEARNASAAVKNGLRAAGPRGMRLRINIQRQRIAILAIGRTGNELAAISHHDIDGVIVRVNAFFHRIISLIWRKKPRLVTIVKFRLRSIQEAQRGGK
jgi:hypothetical protein